MIESDDKAILLFAGMVCILIFALLALNSYHELNESDYDQCLDKCSSLSNDKEVTERAFKNAVDFLGNENVVEIEPRMTAEDFAYFAQKVPSCFYRLGTSNKLKGIASGLHTPNFNVDEKSLEVGMGLMTWLAINELNNKNERS